MYTEQTHFIILFNHKIWESIYAYNFRSRSYTLLYCSIQLNQPCFSGVENTSEHDFSIGCTVSNNTIPVSRKVDLPFG